MQNKNPLFYIIVYIFFLTVFIQFFYSLKGVATSTPIDFLHYYLSSEALLSDKNPYVFVPTHKLSTGAPIIFNYPPTALILFWPLALLPIEFTRIIWLIFIFICLLISIKLSFKLLEIKENKITFFLTLTFSLLSFPVRHTFGMGQVSIIILALILSSFYFLKKQKTIFAGFFLALAMVIKIFPVLILPFLLLKKQWKFIFFVLMFITLFLIISYLFVGFSGWKMFLSVLPKPDFALTRINYYEQDITAFVARLNMDFIFKKYLFYILEFLILFGTAIKIKKNKNNNLSPKNISLILITIVIATGFNWQHYLAILLFPFITAFFMLKKANVLFKILLLCSYLLVSFNIKNPEVVKLWFNGAGNIFLSHGFFGAIMLWFLLMFYPEKNE